MLCRTANKKQNRLSSNSVEDVSINFARQKSHEIPSENNLLTLLDSVILGGFGGIQLEPPSISILRDEV